MSRFKDDIECNSKNAEIIDHEVQNSLESGKGYFNINGVMNFLKRKKVAPLDIPKKSSFSKGSEEKKIDNDEVESKPDLKDDYNNDFKSIDEELSESDASSLDKKSSDGKLTEKPHTKNLL